MKTYLGTLLAPISWGTTYVTITEFLPDDRPLTVAALRVLPAGLLLVGIGLARSGWRPRGHEWVRHGLIALFNFGLFFPLLVVATYRLPGGVVGAAGGLQPLLVAALTYALFRGRPSRRQVATGVIAAIGVGMVMLRPGVEVDAIGVGATVVATLSFAVAIVLTKHFPPARDRIAATGWQLLLSSLLLIPIAVIAEGTPPTLGPSELAAFAYLSLATTGIAFVLWFTGIERLPTPAPPLLGLAAPLTGAAVGWVALGQSLSLIQILGFGLTITAITLGVRPHRALVDHLQPTGPGTRLAA
ncbi:MAG: DMT family transporter [Acidimicrobiia bacterium]